MAFLKKILSKKEEGGSTPNETGVKMVGNFHVGKSGILLYPHVTEKTSLQASLKKYVFAVAKSANKSEVAEAVEKRFSVSVRSVHVINIPSKQRRRGRQIGWKPGIKKAIVQLAEGQTIEVQ